MLIVSWFARLFPGRAVSPSASSDAAQLSSDNVATTLLQSAHSLAGLDPHEAEHLRHAAQAWLSVVR